MVPAINIDAPVHLPDIDARFWAVLRQFEPFGPSNPKPVFVNRDLRVVGRPSTVGRDGSHLRFTVRQHDGGAAMPVIGFGLGPHIERVVQSQQTGSPLEMVFTVDENEYRGQKSIQLKARDVRLAS
jgi:single-stranded-DNA-specific exonuclease